MKALVTYYSKTGNTEKLARAIYDAIDVEKHIESIEKVKDLAGYDIVFCGFPVMTHSVPPKVENFIRGLPAGQKIAFFSTHGSLKGGHLPKQAFEHALGLASKHKILGHFGCRGRVDFKVIDAVSRQPEHAAWAEEAMGAHEHPNAADLQDAGKFARDMIVKVRK